MRKQKKFLDFVERPARGKTTKTILVYSAVSGLCLGGISWYSAWRRYCFMPNRCTVFDCACLDEIAVQLSGLMSDHAVELAERKAAK